MNLSTKATTKNPAMPARYSMLIMVTVFVLMNESFCLVKAQVDEKKQDNTPEQQELLPSQFRRTLSPTPAPTDTSQPTPAPVTSLVLSPASSVPTTSGATSSPPTFEPTSWSPSVSSVLPSAVPSVIPSALPTSSPSSAPSAVPSTTPSKSPTATPSSQPSGLPTLAPITAPHSITECAGEVQVIADDPFVPYCDGAVTYGDINNATVDVTVEQCFTANFGNESDKVVEWIQPVYRRDPAEDLRCVSSDREFNVALGGTRSYTLVCEPRSVFAILKLYIQGGSTAFKDAATANIDNCESWSNGSRGITEYTILVPCEVCIPSAAPSSMPSAAPSMEPTAEPSASPSMIPSTTPSASPSSSPSVEPSVLPSAAPSSVPSWMPSLSPSQFPTSIPSSLPSATPSSHPSADPSSIPSTMPSSVPSGTPSATPSIEPSAVPSDAPSSEPSALPTIACPEDIPILSLEAEYASDDVLILSTNYEESFGGIRCRWSGGVFNQLSQSSCFAQNITTPSSDTLYCVELLLVPDGIDYCQVSSVAACTLARAALASSSMGVPTESPTMLSVSLRDGIEGVNSFGEVVEEAEEEEPSSGKASKKDGNQQRRLRQEISATKDVPKH